MATVAAPVATVPATPAAKADAGTIQLNETTLTQAELDEVLAVNAKWPWPAHRDPWVLAHNTIRKDMADLTTALEAVAAGVKNGAPLEAWQVAYLKAYMPMFHNFVHHHHDIEEQIFFPWMQTKADIGNRLSAAHATLVEILDRLRDGAALLKVTGKADADVVVVEALKATLAELRPQMEEHFKEEEDKGLPLLRIHFSAKEVKPIDAKITKTLTPQDLAHFLNPITDKAEKRQLMTQLGVPGIIQSLVMLPACKKFDKVYQSKLRELQAGKRAAPKSSCFAA